MFENLDNKLKSFAKIYFTIQCIATIISVIATFVVAIELWWAAILGGLVYMLMTVFTTWVIYAIGQILENQNDILSNQRSIMRQTQDTADVADLIKTKNKKEREAITQTDNPTQKQVSHKWRCKNCGRMISASPCEWCGE